MIKNLIKAACRTVPKRQYFSLMTRCSLSTNFCTNKQVGSTNCLSGREDSASYYGIRPVRKCNHQQIQMLEQAYSRLLQKGGMELDGKQINWSTIFMNGKFYVPQDEFWKKFDEMIRRIFHETEKQGQTFYSYGFLVNPTNSQKDQFYHFDYAGQTGIMFISMVYHTTENSTQYLANFKPSSKAELGPRNYNSYGNNDIELLEQENVDFLQVSQTICRPYMILKAGKKTIHRGIKNRGSFPRPIFWLDFGYHDYVVQQTATYSFGKQEERRKQLQKKGQYKEYYKEE